MQWGVLKELMGCVSLFQLILEEWFRKIIGSSPPFGPWQRWLPEGNQPLPFSVDIWSPVDWRIWWHPHADHGRVFGLQHEPFDVILKKLLTLKKDSTSLGLAFPENQFLKFEAQAYKITFIDEHDIIKQLKCLRRWLQECNQSCIFHKMSQGSQVFHNLECGARVQACRDFILHHRTVSAAPT